MTHMFKLNNQKSPFGVKDQICYMFGDAGGSFVNLYVDAYFLVFCTYVLEINPAFMGIMFFVARIWDAINDPLIGSIPDRYIWGRTGDRFKPYIKFFMFPLAISGVLCFLNVSKFPLTWKYVWVSVSYIIYGMSYTATSMPYGSLATVMTHDPIESAKLSRARNLGAGIVGICLAFVPQILYDSQSNPVPSAFSLVAIFFGFASLICYIILLNGTTERIHYNVIHTEYNYAQILRNCFRNRPLIGTMIAAVGFLFYNTGYTQAASYLFKEYYHDTNLITMSALITMSLMLIIFPFVPKIVKKIGKVNSILYPTAIGFVLNLILFIIPIKNPYLYLLINMFGVVGLICYALNCWAIISDCVEYHEWKFNERVNGSIYSIYTFSRKIGSALASTFLSFSLVICGFDTSMNIQPEVVSRNIRILVTSVLYR